MAKKMKAILASRTVWLSIVQGLAGVALAIFAVEPALSTTGLGLVVKSLVDFTLRIQTSEAIK